MRREIALLAGVATGVVAAAVAFRRRARTSPDAGGRDPRAEELRRKLDEARETAAEEGELGAESPPEPVPGERTTREDSPVTGVVDDVVVARRRVHEEGRAAAEEMRRDPEDEPS